MKTTVRRIRTKFSKFVYDDGVLGEVTVTAKPKTDSGGGLWKSFKNAVYDFLVKIEAITKSMEGTQISDEDGVIVYGSNSGSQDSPGTKTTGEILGTVDFKGFMDIANKTKSTVEDVKEQDDFNNKKITSENIKQKNESKNKAVLGKSNIQNQIIKDGHVSIKTTIGFEWYRTTDTMKSDSHKRDTSRYTIYNNSLK